MTTCAACGKPAGVNALDQHGLCDACFAGPAEQPPTPNTSDSNSDRPLPEPANRPRRAGFGRGLAFGAITVALLVGAFILLKNRFQQRFRRTGHL